MSETDRGDGAVGGAFQAAHRLAQGAAPSPDRHRDREVTLCITAQQLAVLDFLLELLIVKDEDKAARSMLFDLRTRLVKAEHTLGGAE